jgi:tetrapyrrole methylase family protein/MazG family protein
MIVVGLGPGDFSRIPRTVADLLIDPATTVVVRTIRHPAAEELASRRPVLACDDLYEAAERFDEVYDRIVDRLAALSEPVVYAVPGSPLVGEFAVAKLRRWAAAAGRPLEIQPAESFLDVLWSALEVDPFRDGFQLLNGHEMPSPLVLDKPTVIGHLDTPLVLEEVCDRIDRSLGEEAEVVLAVDLGTSAQRLVKAHPDAIDRQLAGLRTSMFVAPQPAGLIGAVEAMRRLRQECPWDREQTHDSLVRYLVEESHELIDAIARLTDGPGRWPAYSAIEDELGDVLLQVLFHAAIAEEAGAFGIDDVGHRLRHKLVRRHPHVFGDVEADDAATVRRNWDEIKKTENPGTGGSLLDGVPGGLPSLARAGETQRRAAAVGFDWSAAGPVLAKIREELDELEVDLADPPRAEAELGDVLFSVVNLARHLGVEPELALRRSTLRFEERFRAMEAIGPLPGPSLEELDARWETAKGTTSGEA